MIAVIVEHKHLGPDMNVHFPFDVIIIDGERGEGHYDSLDKVNLRPSTTIR